MKKCLLCHCDFDGYKNVCEKCYKEKVLPIKSTYLKRTSYTEPIDW